MRRRRGWDEKINKFFQVAADYPGNELYFRVIMLCRQLGRRVLKSIAAVIEAKSAFKLASDAGS